MEHATAPLALRRRQAAKLLNVCEKTLLNWTRVGIIPHIRVRGVVLYPVDLLQEWLRQQAARQQAEAVELVEGQGNGNV